MREAGGGEGSGEWAWVLTETWVGGGVATRFSKPLHLFRPKYVIFLTLFQTTNNSLPYFNCLRLFVSFDLLDDREHATLEL